MDENGTRTIEGKSPEVARKSRSTGLMALGALLFLVAVVATIAAGGSTGAGAILFGLVGIGLIVGGLVLRR